MTPFDFRSWMDRLKFGWEDAAEALDVTTRTARRYADGSRPIPGPVQKLCACLEKSTRRSGRG